MGKPKTNNYECPSCGTSGECKWCRGVGKREHTWGGGGPYAPRTDYVKCAACLGTGECHEKTAAGYRCYGSGWVTAIS